MKRFIVLLITLMLFTQTLPALAAETAVIKTSAKEVVLALGNQKALIDGNIRSVYLDNLALFPFILNDRSLLPLRAIGEIFGADVTWDTKSQTATVKSTEHEAKITLGKASIVIDGTPQEIDTKAIIVYGRAFLPLRVIAEKILDKNIGYIENTDYGLRTVIISDDKKTDKQLSELSAIACDKIVDARDKTKNGLDKDGYYYINGRAYMVDGFAEKRSEDICKDKNCPLYDKNVKIPLISFNWQLLSDPRIAGLIKNDVMSLMEPVKVDGLKFTLYVRREVADEAKLIVEDIVKSGFKVTQIGCQRFGSQDFIGSSSSSGKEPGSMWARFHPNGLAIDINWDDNPILYSSSSSYTSEKEHRKTLTDPIDPKFHFNEHAVVEAFAKHGWPWGIWRTTTDYMHFSLGEY